MMLLFRDTTSSPRADRAVAWFVAERHSLCLRYSLIILGYRSPGLVPIKAVHLREFAERFSSYVFLVDNTVLADDEGLHTRLAVFRWCGHKAKASDHRTFHYVVHLAERRTRALAFENLEGISVVWL